MPRSARAEDSRSSRPGFEVAHDHPALAFGLQARDLLRVDAGDERRLQRIARQAIDLSLVAGGDEQRAGRLEGDVVRQILARLPDQIRCAVGLDSEERASRRPRSRGCRRRGLCGRDRRFRDGDHGDFRRDAWRQHLRRRLGAEMAQLRRRTAASAHRGDVDVAVWCPRGSCGSRCSSSRAARTVCPTHRCGTRGPATPCRPAAGRRDRRRASSHAWPWSRRRACPCRPA